MTGGERQPVGFDEFVSTYAQQEVSFNGMPMDIETAVVLEALCPIDLEKETTEIARVTYLARLVGENLLPEHRWMLEAHEPRNPRT